MKKIATRERHLHTHSLVLMQKRIEDDARDTKPEYIPQNTTAKTAEIANRI